MAPKTDQLADPRPELPNGRLWRQVLEVAWETDRETHAVLRSLRIIGVELVEEEDRLRMEPRTGDPQKTDLVDMEDWREVRKRWLLPRKTEIKTVFTKVEQELEAVGEGAQAKLPVD